MGVLIKIEPVTNLHIPDEGMDVCMMVHPGQSQVGQASISPTLAVQSFEVEFHGVSTENHYCCKQIFRLTTNKKPAHAAGAPWDGINALDAATMAYASINAMRQQLHPSDRVHGIIVNGGEAPNSESFAACVIILTRHVSSHP